MTVVRVSLFDLVRTARKDMLAAMDLVPIEAELSRVGFGVPLVIAQQFSVAHQVLVTDADSYRKPWIVRQVVEDGLGENLFTTEGDAWLRRRQPCAPVFGVQNVEALAETMASTVAALVEGWQGGEIDIQEAMTDLTIHIALRCLLGTDNTATTGLAGEVRREFQEILDWITFRFNRPVSLPAMVPTQRNRRLKASQMNLRKAIERMIEYRRDHDDGSMDVLSQLVRAQTTSRHELTDDAILDECIGFMFAGHETTAATLTWALYELSKRPGLQESIAAEGERLRRASGNLVPDLQAMEHTGGVIQETLRMYPAGISIARSAKRTTEIGGERIRRGTIVMIPVYAIQRSPLVWDRPNEFDPTRDHKGNREGFLPFGLGPRRCLGARFARTELRIALGLICSMWRLTYEQTNPPKPIVAPSLRAEGELHLNLAKRSATT